ncbi:MULTISPECIES: integrase core domain-containing protein [Streptomyces]|uniref:integrase core domain-containing protein n=1 Tax=Streptomyces TaxID=1883 RepID=UPI0033DBB715
MSPGSTRLARSPRISLTPASDASIGTVGDALDNTLMESQIGRYKTESIELRKPWHGLAAVALATAEWVDWFNDQRLHTANGDIPPHEHETNYYTQHQPRPAAEANAQSLQRSRSGSHSCAWWPLSPFRGSPSNRPRRISALAR